MFGKMKTDQEIVKDFFSGSLRNLYFCAKSNDKYSLFRRFLSISESNQAIDSITGRILTNELSFSEKQSFEKGKFYEIRTKYYPAALTFKNGAKVLALKPTENGLFSVKFYPATVVSEAKTCPRKFRDLNNIDRPRHEYDVKFDDEKEKTYSVYEELIVPLEKDWGNVKDVYPDYEIEKPTKEQKESKDESQSQTDESTSSSTSSDEEEERKEKRRKHHHKHHKHHSKRNRKHETDSPSIVIIPIIIPYGGFPQQNPYFYQ